MSQASATKPSAATVPTEIPMLIGGEWRAAEEIYEVRDPYRGTVVSHAPLSSLADLDDALKAAVSAKAKAAATPAYERAALLRRAGKLLVERAEQAAEIMARETGKAIKDAKAEIVRSQDTLSLSAEEAVRIEGEHVPLDASAMGAGKICFMLRFPVGVVAGITPFNAPFNLACHKIAPAIAAGNTLVLKAPPQSPGVIHALAQIFVDAGTPPGFVNVLYGDRVGPALVRDPRVDFITFTGSSRVGAEIKAASGLRRVALELGGNGPTIVHQDASVEEAAPLCARNSMRLAGQSCISVQNVFVHTTLYQPFVERLVEEVAPSEVRRPARPADRRWEFDRRKCGKTGRGLGGRCGCPRRQGTHRRPATGCTGRAYRTGRSHSRDARCVRGGLRSGDNGSTIYGHSGSV